MKLVFEMYSACTLKYFINIEYFHYISHCFIFLFFVLGKYKCRESWPSNVWESSFNLFLDGILLAVPLILMATAYLRIGLVLQKEITENRVFEAGVVLFKFKRLNIFQINISNFW